MGGVSSRAFVAAETSSAQHGELGISRETAGRRQASDGALRAGSVPCVPLIAALCSQVYVHVCGVCSCQLTHQMTSHMLAAAGGMRAGLGAAAGAGHLVGALAGKLASQDSEKRAKAALAGTFVPGQKHHGTM